MTQNPDQNQPGPRPEPQVAITTEAATTSDGPAAEDLKGAALDKALEDAGLPKTGTADEKRERIAEATE